MDLDIFKRKAETRGYSCPPTENGFVIYKPISVSAEKGTVELTVQSSLLSFPVFRMEQGLKSQQLLSCVELLKKCPLPALRLICLQAIL